MSEYAYKKLSPRQFVIMDLLEKHERPIEAYSFAAMLGILHLTDAHRIVRREIAELVAMGYPVGSDAEGFFLIKTEKQLQQVLNGLLKKQVALSKRIANLYDGFYSR